MFENLETDLAVRERKLEQYDSMLEEAVDTLGVLSGEELYNLVDRDDPVQVYIAWDIASMQAQAAIDLRMYDHLYPYSKAYEKLRERLIELGMLRREDVLALID